MKSRMPTMVQGGWVRGKALGSGTAATVYLAKRSVGLFILFGLESSLRSMVFYSWRKKFHCPERIYCGATCPVICVEASENESGRRRLLLTQETRLLFSPELATLKELWSSLAARLSPTSFTFIWSKCSAYGLALWYAAPEFPGKIFSVIDNSLFILLSVLIVCASELISKFTLVHNFSSATSSLTFYSCFR